MITQEEKSDQRIFFFCSINADNWNFWHQKGEDKKQKMKQMTMSREGLF